MPAFSKHVFAFSKQVFRFVIFVFHSENRSFVLTTGTALYFVRFCLFCLPPPSIHFLFSMHFSTLRNIFFSVLDIVFSVLDMFPCSSIFFLFATQQICVRNKNCPMLIATLDFGFCQPQIRFQRFQRGNPACLVKFRFGGTAFRIQQSWIPGWALCKSRFERFSRRNPASTTVTALRMPLIAAYAAYQ